MASETFRVPPILALLITQPLAKLPEPELTHRFF